MSAMLESLPDRPLLAEEADRLVDDRIVPLSVLLVEGPAGAETPTVYTLMIHVEDRVTVVGFDEDRGGWVRIWSADSDDWSMEEQEEVVQEWLRERYGDEASVGTIDTETLDVELED